VSERVGELERKAAREVRIRAYSAGHGRQPGFRDSALPHFDENECAAVIAREVSEPLRQENAKLRKCLREMLASARPNQKEYPTMYNAWEQAESLLREESDGR
jgi:hypothetical protein